MLRGLLQDSQPMCREQAAFRQGGLIYRRDRARNLPGHCMRLCVGSVAGGGAVTLHLANWIRMSAVPPGDGRAPRFVRLRYDLGVCAVRASLGIQYGPAQASPAVDVKDSHIPVRVRSWSGLGQVRVRPSTSRMALTFSAIPECERRALVISRIHTSRSRLRTVLTCMCTVRAAVIYGPRTESDRCRRFGDCN